MVIINIFNMYFYYIMFRDKINTVQKKTARNNRYGCKRMLIPGQKKKVMHININRSDKEEMSWE